MKLCDDYYANSDNLIKEYKEELIKQREIDEATDKVSDDIENKLISILQLEAFIKAKRQAYQRSKELKK